jgi:cyclophilin family peptidyl-prolyl cis-trans isomerase
MLSAAAALRRASALLYAGIAAIAFAAPVQAHDKQHSTTRSMSDIVNASQPSDWRLLDADNTLYLELPAGRVVIELAPAFAPNHVANIKALVRERYFDGLSIIRSQDNYVVQWGDPDGKREIKTAKRHLPQEFTTRTVAGMPFTKLPDADTYAPQVGHAYGYPVARDPQSGRTWLAHCYGMVGAGRDNDADSGGGVELYVVIGHAPRHLDRNVTLVGRVMQGIELLSTLPRGSGALGFYEKPEQHVPIASVRVAADVPAEQRVQLEILRTDTPTFRAAVDALRHRGGDWYKFAAGRVELCNVPVPVRIRE